MRVWAWLCHRETDDPEWYAIHLDWLDRMATLTEPSYRAWQARLLPEDLADDRTNGFIAFMEARIADKDERVWQHGTHLAVPGQQADQPSTDQPPPPE